MVWLCFLVWVFLFSFPRVGWRVLARWPSTWLRVCMRGAQHLARLSRAVLLPSVVNL